MNPYFQIEFKKHNNTLHVDPRGDFDGNSAWELIHLLHAQYDDVREVVIETRHLREMCPFGCRMFQCQLKLTRVPADRLVFQGEKGRAIAPVESRVVVGATKGGCGCSGDCANCPCSAEKGVKADTGGRLPRS
ncbi:hypothetical protein [Desulfatitalea alkaliphila]|uniref:Uncharacterized protein n=1 Tax=Desulfatitalea alkaliphila TaxID=2929485 RepID=A0AA41UNS0_9BACT|nr:hypothetical protein [Desulfatitalea alkaliphila]MCJ8499768.1 hypothetical protein [Desulfatitalea alkaliphila]